MVFTATPVPPEGTLFSVQAPMPTELGASVSVKLTVTWSTFPFAFLSSMDIDIMTGAAPSAGDSGKNDDWFPAASAIPPVAAFRPILKLPTEVSGAPGPSVSVRIALLPLTDTELSEPPDGTPVSVQGAVPAEYGARVSENFAVTWSTFPFEFVSCIASDMIPGGV